MTDDLARNLAAWDGLPDSAAVTVNLGVLRAMAGRSWQPIETAPAGRCLMWVADGRGEIDGGGVAVAGTVYVYPDQRTYAPDGFHGPWLVTHWMPALTAPPA